MPTAEALFLLKLRGRHYVGAENESFWIRRNSVYMENLRFRSTKML